MSDLTQYHIQRLGSLKSDRGNWDVQWEEAAARIVPSHVNTFTSRGMLISTGQKNTEQMFDATAAFAAQRFTSVMESLTIPQSSIWHRLVPVDKTLKRNRAVRLFFDELTELLFSYRYRPIANFVGNSQQAFLGLGVYGNGTLFVDQPDREKGLRYRNIHLGEVWFVENHAGIVDTMYRSIMLSARQVVSERNWKVPQEVRDAAADAGRADKKEWEVLHVVYPREDFNPVRLDGPGKRFASIHILCKTQDLLREWGYDSWPFPTARYTQAPGETYGRGPAQFVLPSIKVLNEQKRTVLKQGHRIVDPVLLSHDDDRLGSFSLKAGALNPGGINKDGKRMVDVLPTGNIAVGHEMMDIEKRIINDAFLITLFQILIDTPQMTATEVLERAREKGMLLAPTAGRLQAEFLGPLIERELDLMLRQGIWPANMPSILRDAQAAEYKIEYDSPMSRMQRAEKASGFMRALDVAANYAKATLDPEPLDWFNFDAAMPELLDIHGAPTSWVRSIEDVQSKRATRTEQQQQQQAVDAAPAAASVVKSLGGAK